MPRRSDARQWRAGKLPASHLERLLAALPQRDPRVVLGPQIGEDAAVLDMGDRSLVTASDPVTFATDRIGWYAVHVNANDVAVLGADPRWFLAVLLLPEGGDAPELARTIMRDIQAACESLGVTVCGGHTEITAGLERPIVVGHMLGELQNAPVVRKDQLEPGDQIIMTRGIAIEGTALIAREKSDTLEGSISDEIIQRAAALLSEPGISVVEAARIARAAGDVRAMHDPTEGGVYTGLVELVTPSGLGLEVHADRIPVLEETAAVCRQLALDPMGLLASGTLLLAVPPDATETVTTALQSHQIPATVIGEVQPAGFGLRSRVGDHDVPLVVPVRDELATLFERDARKREGLPNGHGSL